MILRYQKSIIKIIVANAGIYNIFVGVRCRFFIIKCIFPFELHFCVSTKFGAELLNGEGLHHIFSVILRSNEFEHPFVYRTTHCETKCRIQSISHIGKVLMRKQFEQHGGYIWNACFTIRPIP